MATPARTAEQIRADVRDRYGRLADAAGATSCCGSGGACCSGELTVLDVGEDYGALPGYVPEADLRLGCGLPTEHAGIRPGDTVLDLGSGAGNDAFVARALTGEAGQVIGVDMTPAMIARATAAAARLGFANVSFRAGVLEDLPVDDATVDVALSNCVFNLVPDKAAAFREVFRVLRPGGRFCISDIVSDGALPPSLRDAAALYAGCIAGALPLDAYLALIEAAGFADVRVVTDRPLPVPGDVLAPYLPEGDPLRERGVALRSVTVTGTRPA